MTDDDQIRRWRQRAEAMVPSDDEIMRILEKRWKVRKRNGMTVEQAIAAERHLQMTLAAVTIIRAEGTPARVMFVRDVCGISGGSVNYRLDRLQERGLAHVADDGAWTTGPGKRRYRASPQRTEEQQTRTISKPEFDAKPDRSGEVRCPGCEQWWHSPDRFNQKFHDFCRPKDDGAGFFADSISSGYRVSPTGGRRPL